MAAQQYFADTQFGLLNTINAHVGIELNNTGSTFGSKITLGLNPDSQFTVFDAHADAYYRFAFNPNSRSGFYLGLGAGFLSITGFSSLNNGSPVTFQYLITSGFAGLQLEFVPALTGFLEVGAGLPLPISIAKINTIGGFAGSLFLSLLGIFRLNLGLSYYF